ncbi:3-oxoacyl-[acyl-carrier-protein] reductase [soil metagenome]
MLITGGTRGIGRALTIFFSKSYNVSTCYSGDVEAAEELLDACRPFGNVPLVIKADVGSYEDVERLIASTIEKYQSLDVVINNAAINIDRPFLKMSRSEYERVIDVNLHGSFYVSQLAARYMVNQGGGQIVFLGSTTGIVGRKNGANYCTSKAGILMLTKCLAKELGPLIRVNCIVPGFTRTPETEERFGLKENEQYEITRRDIPLKRIGEVDDIVKVAEFLVSDSAAYINGQKIIVNGGEFMY